CASAFDEVSINVDAAPSAAIAGADQTVCATTATLAANTPGTGTGAWSVVSGTAVFSNASQPNSGVSGLAVGANVLRWTISNGVCVSSFDDIIITREQSPVADAGIDQRVCIGTNIVLQANSANGGVWTLVSGSGVIQTPGQANSSVQGLSAGVSVFKWTVPGNTCPASSDQVNITVDALPSLANAGPDQNICNTGSTVSGNTPVSGNGTWSIISGNGLVSSPNSPVTGVNSLSPGQNILQWSIVNGVCPASTDQVNIQVLQAPSGANAGTDQEVCGNTAQLDAAQPDAGTGTWSLISGGGTFANPAQRNTQVSGLSNGLNIFRWTVTNGNCPVRADEVQIHSYTAPTPASAGADASICNLPLVLQGNTPISGSGLWTIVSGGGSLSNPGQPNAGVSNMNAGQLVLRWTISNGACPPSFDEVVYSVYNQPFASAGQNTLICSSTINMSGNAVAGANGNWSFVSGSGNIQSPGNPQTFVSNLAQGANTLVWTLNNSVCPVSRDTVVITRYLEPDNPIAGADIHTCASNAQLNANTPVSGTGFWVVLQGGGIIDAPSSASTMVTNLSSGKNVLIWTISNGTCNPRSDTLEIKVDTNPTSANAGTDQDICGNSTALSAVNPLVGNGTWVLVSGTGNIQLPDQAVTALTNLGVGKNTFRWTVVNGSCVTSDEVQITRYLPPSPADAGPDQSICSSTSQLNAAAINVGNGNWSLISGGGTLTNAGSRTSAVTGLAYGANVFRWTVSSGACPANNDEVTIFRQTEPGPALVAADTAICAATIQISASTPQAGTGIWSLVSGSGEINNPLLVNISLSALAAGENVFRWTVVNGDCPAVSDEITILRHLPPSTANAGADFSSCLTDITLNAVIPATGTGTWSRLSGLGNILQATNAKSAVNNLIPGISVFEWTVSNGTCPVSRDQVQVEVFPGPGQPDAGLDVTICGDSTIVSGNFPDNASSLWSVLSGSGIIPHPAVAQTSVKQLTGGENVLVYTFSNGPCQAYDTLKIYAFMPPGLAFAGNDTSICADEFIALAEAPQAGSGQWSVLEGNALLAADSLASTLIQLPEEGEYVFYWEITNGVCPANGDTLVIIRDIQPDTAGIISNSAIICTDSLWLQAKNYTLSQGTWSILSGDGIFSSTDSAHTALTGIGEGLNQIEWVLTKGACRSADTIEIERFLNPAPLSLGGDLKICGLNASLDAEVPDFGQGQWIYDETRSGLDDPSSAFTTIEAYQEGVLRYIWEHSNGPCIARDSVEITFYIQPDAHAGDDITICSGDTAYLQGNIPDAGVSTWSLITGEGLILQPYFQNSEFIPKEEGNYYLRWTVVNEMCRDSDLVVVSVRSPNDPFCMNKAGKLFVPDGFSPNADGVFDYLVIQKPFGSRVSLQVFDRLGNMVYESRDYQNDWDGRPRKGLVLYGDQLPESTYFYILRIDDKDEEYKGYFTLWR
ncbi:MAG: gliding motility-associated C-terminal domain-containing protein, partial [Bacteroidia bacterium]|nr:gliding motility-associated C-terminal domain-containing protein [Bacteroidia bacterium]